VDSDWRAWASEGGEDEEDEGEEDVVVMMCANG